MPSLANITVKKNDGTTDVTYSGIVPSAGDKSPAIWRNTAQGTAPAHNPSLSLSSEWNGPKTARRMRGQYVMPSTATGSDGKVNVVDRAILELSVIIPQGMVTADINEFVSQGVNLCAATLIKDSLKSGYSPT
jgi:hypothetical protein